MKKLVFLLALLLIPCVAFAGVTVGSFRTVNATSQSTTQVSSTSIPFFDAKICTEPDNTGYIGLGVSTLRVSVDSTVNTAPALDKAVCVTFTGNELQNGNLNQFYIGSTVSGDGVGVVYTQRSI